MAFAVKVTVVLMPCGAVLSAVTVTPNAGSELKRGDAVTLLVSRGQQTFTVPDVRGASLDDEIPF